MKMKLLWVFALGVGISNCGIRAARDPSSSVPYVAPPPSQASSDSTASPENKSNRAVLLRWSDPITAENLMETPDPSIAGRSLADIVGSFAPGRADALLCSSCHNQAEAPKGYGVLVQDGGKGKINGITQKMGTPSLTWAQDGGWTDKFVTNATKPEELKKAFLAWKASGYPP